MSDLVDAAVAHDHVRLPGEDGSDEAWDLVAGVLVVGVGVDDDVGPQAQAGVEAGHEAGGQALAPREADDVVGPVRARHLRRPVGGAVIDHQHLHDVDAGNGAGDGLEGFRQRRLFVEAGDLND